MLVQLENSPTSILPALANQVGLPSGATQRQVLGELIRYAFLSGEEFSSQEFGMFVSRILDFVRIRFEHIGQDFLSDDMLAPSDTKSLNAVIREVMDELDSLGEITEMAGGYWSALPSRFVALNRKLVLLSTLPTQSISELLERPVHAESLTRSVDESAVGLISSKGFIEQSVESWLGNLKWDPDDLLNILFSEVTRESTHAEITGEFQIYCPWETKATQKFRWKGTDSISTLPDGPHLCRLFGRSRVPRFWIGNVLKIDSQWIGTSEYSLPANLACKVQFALDKKNGVQNKVKTVLNETEMAMDFDFRLPFEHYRLIKAIATEESTPRKWERRFVFDRSYKETLENYMKCLNIDYGN